ncbi:hypothetical protein BJ742DRAFT_736301 [Cladochytrium replicatum]|nr:hypothetical protein BJ742DRAFT_736301 [Cladochytrium replicatum]
MIRHIGDSACGNWQWAKCLNRFNAKLVMNVSDHRLQRRKRDSQMQNLRSLMLSSDGERSRAAQGSETQSSLRGRVWHQLNDLGLTSELTPSEFRCTASIRLGVEEVLEACAGTHGHILDKRRMSGDSGMESEHPFGKDKNLDMHTRLQWAFKMEQIKACGRGGGSNGTGKVGCLTLRCVHFCVARGELLEFGFFSGGTGTTLKEFVCAADVK